jgi:hypothetical protein
MNQVTLSDDIKSEISIAFDGKCSLSLRATASLLGVTQPTLTVGLRVIGSSSSKLAQNLTEKGFDPDSFSESGVPDLALPVIAFYYAVQAGKRCTAQAKAVLEVFAAIGARTWLQQSKNYQQPVATTTNQTLLLPPITTRKQINKLVNDYSFFTGFQHERVWRKIYTALNDHFEYDIYKKKEKDSKLDRIEKDGHLENLLTVAQQYLQVPNNILAN